MIADSIDGIMMIFGGFVGFYILRNPKFPQNYIKKFMRFGAPFLIIIGVIFAVKPFFEEKENGQDWQYIAKQINDATAGHTDGIARVDSVTFENQNELCFYYSVLNISSEDFDDELKEEVKRQVILNVQNNTKIRPFLQDGISIIARYFDTVGLLITEIRVSLDDIEE